MHLCKTLLIAICFVAVTSAIGNGCIVVAGGAVFNLCPLKDPITFSFKALPFFLNGDNITFSLVEKNTPTCDGTANEWVKVSDPNSSICVDNINDPIAPTYSVRMQNVGLPILKVTYQWSDSETDRLEVNLYCNPQGKKNNEIDFFVNNVESDILSFSGYSYYGCPISASIDGFLSLKNTQL